MSYYRNAFFIIAIFNSTRTHTDFKDDFKILEEERESLTREAEIAEEMSPNLRRYWRRRAEELKEENFYLYATPNTNLNLTNLRTVAQHGLSKIHINDQGYFSALHLSL